MIELVTSQYLSRVPSPVFWNGTVGAVGPECIRIPLLVRHVEWCSKYFSILFEKSLTTATLTKEWKTAKIIPVHKVRLDTQVCDSSLISLLRTTPKILKRFKNISKFLEDCFLFSRHHQGFHRGIFTTTQLVEVTHYFFHVIDATVLMDVILGETLQRHSTKFHTINCYLKFKVLNNTLATKCL